LQIGTRYLKGQAAPQSNTRARAWFTIAAQNGSADARTNLKELESRLTPEDLKAGEQERARQVNRLSRFAAATAN
jgi:TPR repeat protein